MEKRRPTFLLQDFRDRCGDPATLAIARTALGDAVALGFDRNGIAAVVRSMKPFHFYKSMTSFRDARKWQDVYHVPWEGAVLYIKFSDDAVTAFTILSFKER